MPVEESLTVIVGEMLNVTTLRKLTLDEFLPNRFNRRKACCVCPIGELFHTEIRQPSKVTASVRGKAVQVFWKRLEKRWNLRAS